MPEKIPPHRHCRECGKAIPSADKFCSSDCENAFKSKLKRKRNQLYMFYFIMVIILVGALIFLEFG